MIEPERIKILFEGSDRSPGGCVLYWMQQSQRTDYNHALEYAASEANRLGLPLLVYFGLTDSFPEANERSYQFMLEGLAEVEKNLLKRGILLIVEHVSPEGGVVEFVKKAEPSLLVCDRGYLKAQRKWRRYVSSRVRCKVVEVESDVVVPVETASFKEEFAARTIRPKILRHSERFLSPVLPVRVRIPSLGFVLPSHVKPVSLENIPMLLRTLKIDHSVKGSAFDGGTSHAEKLLDLFFHHKLLRYADDRNEPSFDALSNMSPYLHFGQISPVYIALQLRKLVASDVASSLKTQMDVYLEELIVRRELAMNFCRYNDQYDSFEGLPAWAQKTLRAHEHDRREFVYTHEEFEKAQTHDPIWNAAQNEMVQTGKMHGYMRMYWGKKILEWTRGPAEAFQVALWLNNKYELDGRDPNSFAGVAWCFGKHDRPWGPERKIFGLVRFMNQAGIQRKCDWKRYVSKWG